MNRLTYGVLQATLYGPLLLNIFINDIISVLQKGNFLLFAIILMS